MSITKQRWQLTLCDSTLEHFSRGEIKFLRFRPGAKHTSMQTHICGALKHSPIDQSHFKEAQLSELPYLNK